MGEDARLAARQAKANIYARHCSIFYEIADARGRMIDNYLDTIPFNISDSIKPVSHYYIASICRSFMPRAILPSR